MDGGVELRSRTTDQSGVGPSNKRNLSSFDIKEGSLLKRQRGQTKEKLKNLKFQTRYVRLNQKGLLYYANKRVSIANEPNRNSKLDEPLNICRTKVTKENFQLIQFKLLKKSHQKLSMKIFLFFR